MPIERKTKIYNGKSYTYVMGMDEATGEAPVLIEYGEKSDIGLDQRDRLDTLTLRMGQGGSPISFSSVFEHQQLKANGEVETRLSESDTHYTKSAEIRQLVGRLVDLLKPSIYNGHAAGGTQADKDKTMFLGHPDNRPFNPDGSFNNAVVITPATFDYHDHE